ncbi:uncharacterized protein NPIL_383701 [Nephila pilipes]|uniref:Uncharacterized protein n=1 Tax=Nephila pilipes TaxID=299642 RepID=A0A8X6P038_NEPPI|nr:uncharacterized protein NPIL_383701 [Nephila pilipes]
MDHNGNCYKEELFPLSKHHCVFRTNTIGKRRNHLSDKTWVEREGTTKVEGSGVRHHRKGKNETWCVRDGADLDSQQHTEVMQEIGFEESKEVISTSEIKEILGMWERVLQFVEKKHPEKVTTGRASDLFNDTCLIHFRNILRGRKKQTSLDMFFSKRPTSESEKNVAKKAKTSEDI